MQLATSTFEVVAPATNTTRYAALLGGLTAFFVLRVALQAFAGVNEISVLPAFDDWQTGVSAYWMLLVSQLAIIALLVYLIRAIRDGAERPRLSTGLVYFGVVYFVAMVARTVVGVGQLSDATFFQKPGPTMFHLVLATAAIVSGIALSHDRRTAFASRNATTNALSYALYPVVVALSVGLYVWMEAEGFNIVVASYLCAAFGIVLVLAHETVMPFRTTWVPDRPEFVEDIKFLVLVQLALPGLLKLVVTVALAGAVTGLELWPTGLPGLTQVAIMLVVAEFFRYWMHRYLHVNKRLWQLHAVHHSPDKLYAANVGRFHPLDKGIQFFGDTLPFIVLGVEPEIFTLYFVCYAVNGFYQHSNAYVRLGWLNYVIAGPELHRWHHSKKYSEAHGNYGNNLIVWDVVFGTRFDVAGSEVAALGITNPDWPMQFADSLAAPFTVDADTKS